MSQFDRSGHLDAAGVEGLVIGVVVAWTACASYGLYRYVVGPASDGALEPGDLALAMMCSSMGAGFVGFIVGRLVERTRWPHPNSSHFADGLERTPPRNDDRFGLRLIIAATRSAYRVEEMPGRVVVVSRPLWSVASGVFSLLLLAPLIIVCSQQVFDETVMTTNSLVLAGLTLLSIVVIGLLASLATRATFDLENNQVTTEQFPRHWSSDGWTRPYSDDEVEFVVDSTGGSRMQFWTVSTTVSTATGGQRDIEVARVSLEMDARDVAEQLRAALAGEREVDDTA